MDMLQRCTITLQPLAIAKSEERLSLPLQHCFASGYKKTPQVTPLSTITSSDSLHQLALGAKIYISSLPLSCPNVYPSALRQLNTHKAPSQACTAYLTGAQPLTSFILTRNAQLRIAGAALPWPG